MGGGGREAGRGAGDGGGVLTEAKGDFNNKHQNSARVLTGAKGDFQNKNSNSARGLRTQGPYQIQDSNVLTGVKGDFQNKNSNSASVFTDEKASF